MNDEQRGSDWANAMAPVRAIGFERGWGAGRSAQIGASGQRLRHLRLRDRLHREGLRTPAPIMLGQTLADAEGHHSKVGVVERQRAMPTEQLRVV